MPARPQSDSGRQWIIDLVRDLFDPTPKDWPRHRGWDDGAEDIADAVLANWPLLSRPAPDPRQVSVELAYGLLWLADMQASGNRCIRLARLALIGHLDGEGKRRGLKAAQDLLAVAAAADPERPIEPTVGPVTAQAVFCSQVRLDGDCTYCGTAAGEPCGYELGPKPRTNPRTHVGIMANGLNGKEI
jgi:hypothetical protein